MNIKFKNVHSFRYRSLAFVLSLTVLLSGLVWYGVAQSNQKAEAVYPSRTITYVDADFYDYYNDAMVENSVSGSPEGKYKRPFKYFNQAVSNYASTNSSWEFPLYLGQFWLKDEVDGIASDNIEDNDRYHGLSYHVYNQSSADGQYAGDMGTGINPNGDTDSGLLTRFKWSANLAFRPSETWIDDHKWDFDLNEEIFHPETIDGGANNTPQFYAVATGLVDGATSVNGELVPTSNGVKIPYFDEDFLTDTKVEGNSIAKVYENKSFPFYATDETVDVGIRKSDKTCATEYEKFGPGYRFDSEVDTVYVSSGSYLEEKRGTNVTNDRGRTGFFPFNSSNPDDKDALNYCFGTKFTIDFTMNENGTIDGASWTGEKGTSNDNRAYFVFRGDDDVWVYIDDTLVLDMGGAHKMAEGYVDFNSKKSGVVFSADAVKYQYDIKGDSSKILRNQTKSFAGLNLDDGKSHKMTVFYMERGMIDSNLFIQFNMPTTPHEDMLTITDKVSVEKVNKGLQSQTLAVADSDVVNYTVSNKGTKPSEVHDTGLLYPGSTVIRRYNTEYFSTHPTGGGTDLYEDYGQKVLLSDGRGVADRVTRVLDTANYYFDMSDSVLNWWFDGGAQTYVYAYGNGGSKVRLASHVSGKIYSVPKSWINNSTGIILCRVRSGVVPTASNIWDCLASPKAQSVDITLGSYPNGVVMQDGGYQQYIKIKSGYNHYIESVIRGNQDDKKYLNEFSSDSGFNARIPHTVASTNYELIDPKAQRKNTGSTSGTRPWLSYATSSTAEQTSSSGALNLMYDQSAVFTGQFTVGSEMQIKQDGSLYAPSVRSDTSLPNYTKTTRTLGEYYNISEPKLEYGSGTPGSNPPEAVRGTDGTDTFTFDDVNKDANDNKVQIEAIYTREVKTGSISITKALKNPNETSIAEFTMKVEMSSLLGTNESALGDVTDYSEVDIEGSTLSTKLDSDGKFKMKAGETVKISGIPVGTVVNVSEVDSNESRKYFDLTKVNIQGNTTTGIAVDEERKVVITNTRSTGTVSFKKALGKTAEGYEDKVFTLKIRFGGDFDGKVYNADKINLSDYTLQYYYSEDGATAAKDLTLKNVGGTAAPDLIYEAEFKIKVGQKIYITGVPSGVRFCYKEVFTDSDNLTSVNNNGTYDSSWSPTYKRGSGADKNPQAVRQFLTTSTNDYTITNEQAVGSLKIIKVLQGANGAEITDSTSRNTAFKAKVELQLPEGFDVNKQYFTVSDINRNNVKIRADRVDSGNNIAFFDITFSYSKACTIGNIPFGTKWKVTETDIPSGWEYSKTEYRSTEQYKSFDFYTTGESTSGGGGSTSGGGGSTGGGRFGGDNPPNENKLRHWYETEKGTLNRLIYNEEDGDDEIAIEREIRITNKKAAYLTIEKYIDQLYYGEDDNAHGFKEGSSGVTSPLNDNDPFGYLNYTSAEQDFVFKIEKYNLGTDLSESTSPISTSYVVLKFDKDSLRNDIGYGIASTTPATGSLLEPSGGAYKYKQSTTVKVDPGYLYKVSEVTTGISWRYKLTDLGIEATQSVDGYALVYSGWSEYVAVAYGLKADFSKIPVARFFNNRTTASQTIESDMSSVKNKLIIKQ